MDTYVLYEIIGYAASVLVAVSLMMSAIVKLRIVNMIGAFTFAIYGILIGSIPVAAMNGFIVLINIYYLVQIARDQEYFQLLNVDKKSRYLDAFLDFYRENIQKFQPSFNPNTDHNFSLFVLRNMVPAGLLLGNCDDTKTLYVDLDFVIPDFRDFKIGRYLFDEKKEYFKQQGVYKIRASAGNEQHNRYLEKIGFSMEHEGSHPYELTIS